MGEIVSPDKATLEKRWAHTSVMFSCPEEEKAVWAPLRYTQRPFVYFDKIFIIWAYVNGLPQVRDVLVVTNVTLSFQTGTWLHIESKLTKAVQVVTHAPRQLLGHRVFAWVPFFLETRFVARDWADPAAPRHLKLQACFKSAASREQILEGVDYILELHEFRSAFPTYKDTRF